MSGLTLEQLVKLYGESSVKALTFAKDSAMEALCDRTVPVAEAIECNRAYETVRELFFTFERP